MKRSTEKAPATLRHGGPGASHENAKKPPPPADKTPGRAGRSAVSGGGGERDVHHTHAPKLKGRAKRTH